MSKIGKGILWRHNGVNYLICNKFGDGRSYIAQGVDTPSTLYPVQYIGSYDATTETRKARLPVVKQSYKKVGNGAWVEEQLYGLYEDLLLQERNGLAPYNENDELSEVYIHIIDGTGKDMEWRLTDTNEGIVGIRYENYVAFEDEDGVRHYGQINDDGTLTYIADTYKKIDDGVEKDAVNDRVNGVENVVSGVDENGDPVYELSQDSLYEKYKEILEMPRYQNYAPYTAGMKLEEVTLEVEGTGTGLTYTIVS